MSTNYDFAWRFAPEIADRLNKADEYLYSCQDPVAAVESAGTAMEQLVRHIFIKEGFADTDFLSLRDGIDYLERKSVCPRKIIQKMNRIRRIRNQATHTNQASDYDARIVQKNAHKIMMWCIEEYQLGAVTEYKERSDKRPMMCFEGVFMPLGSTYCMA